MIRFSCLPTLLLSVCVLTGCTFLSGAGSMRIDVEVYKGPLSKEPELQWAELIGLLHETEHSLREYHEALCAIAGTYLSVAMDAGLGPPDTVKKSCVFATSTSGYPHKRSAGDAGQNGQVNPNNGKRTPSVWCGDGRLSLEERQLCFTLAQVHEATSEVEDETQGTIRHVNLTLKSWPGQCIPSTDAGACADAMHTLKRISELSMRLKVKAVNRAFALVTYPPSVDFTWSRAVRFVSTAFANLASEYSNQMGSRADALVKQLRGTDRTELAQSVYLRDSQATDFPNLYIWMRAGGPPLMEDRFLSPFHAFTSDETADRIRIVERLYADNFWSNVNTVYASGQGDVSMAFIKDDIGNWSLKSFDNQPGDLLKAYRESGKALIAAAGELAKQAVPGGGDVSKVNQLLQSANKFALGGMPQRESDSAGHEAKIYHQHTVDLLEALRRRAMERESALSGTLSKNSQAIGELKQKAEAEQAKALCLDATADDNTAAGQQAKQTRERVEAELAQLDDMESAGPVGAALDKARDFKQRSADVFSNAANAADESGKCVVYIQSQAYAEIAGAWLDILHAKGELATHRQSVKAEALRILSDQQIAVDALSRAALASPQE